MSRRSREAEKAAASRRRLIVIASIVAVVVVAAIIAIVATGGGDEKVATSAGSEQTRPVTVTGASLPPYKAGESDSAVGKAIPTIAGQSFNGDAVKIEPGGKAKVLLGVAHWCPHCQREVPLLSESIRAKPLPSNVEMITISTSVQPNADNYPPEEWLKREQWPTSVLADDTKQAAAQSIGLSGFPFFVFVDAQGKVVGRSSGEMPIDQFRATVDKLAAGQPLS